MILPPRALQIKVSREALGSNSTPQHHNYITIVLQKTSTVSIVSVYFVLHSIELLRQKKAQLPSRILLLSGARPSLAQPREGENSQLYLLYD